MMGNLEITDLHVSSFGLNIIPNGNWVMLYLLSFLFLYISPCHPIVYFFSFSLLLM